MIIPTAAQLRQAADIQEQIEALKVELDQVLAVEAAASAPAIEAPEPAKKGRKGFSARTRAKMAAAAKARWAAKRGEVEPETTPAAEAPAAEPKKPKKKRKMTEAWRKALARAHAARRAKAKAARDDVPF